VLEVDDVGRIEFRLRRRFGRGGSDWGHSLEMEGVVVAKRKRGFRSDGTFQIPSGELPLMTKPDWSRGSRHLGSTSGSSDQPTFHLPGNFRHNL